MPKGLKGKKWFTMVAPPYFGSKEIGETLASEPQALIGRRVTIPLVQLTEDFSKYYLKITFRIKKVEGERAFTEFDGLECTRDYIARMVVRRVRRIDAVQDLETKDGKKIRVKTITIISKKAKSSMEKAIRKKVEELVKNWVESLTLEEFLKKVISDELKKKMVEEVNKIYPVRHFEFRKIEML